MNIDIRKTGKISILDISGKMTIGRGDVVLRNRFKELLDAEEKLFIFNMNGVPWLDSAGTGEVVACHKRAREREGNIKIVLGEKGKTKEVFVLACLDRVFDIYTSEEEAIAAFAS